MGTESIVHFDPFVSRVESGFWHELGQRKLEKYQLSEAEQCIGGCYCNGEFWSYTRGRGEVMEHVQCVCGLIINKITIGWSRPGNVGSI